MKGSFRKVPSKRSKKGYVWEFVVDLGKDPATGKRNQIRRRGFGTKREAEDECARLINEHSQGIYVKDTKLLYKSFLDQWLESKETRVRKATYNKYNSLVKNHVQPGLGNMLLSELTPMMLDRFYNTLNKEKQLSNTTISDIHNVIKNSLKQALSWELIQKNPAALVTPPKKDKKEIEIWDFEEGKIFLEAAKGHREYIAFLLALATGMRQSEILGLRWQDINFKTRTISVVQTLEHDGKELVADTKSKNSFRLITVDEESFQEIKKHRKLIVQEKLILGSGYEDNDLVIPTSLGTPINPRNLLRTFYRLMKEAKVKRITFHDLRHTHASWLLMLGENPKAVAERLGHDVRTLMETYAHVLPNMQARMAENFRNAFYNVDSSQDCDNNVIQNETYQNHN